MFLNVCISHPEDPCSLKGVAGSFRKPSLAIITSPKAAKKIQESHIYENAVSPAGFSSMGILPGVLTIQTQGPWHCSSHGQSQILTHGAKKSVGTSGGQQKPQKWPLWFCFCVPGIKFSVSNTTTPHPPAVCWLAKLAGKRSLVQVGDSERRRASDPGVSGKGVLGERVKQTGEDVS